MIHLAAHPAESPPASATEQTGSVLTPQFRQSHLPRSLLGARLCLVRPYEEFIEFIASLSPREVVEFKPSEIARRRVWDLIERQQAAPLPADEKTELDHYLEIEHLMRLAKARARQLLAHGE